MIDPEKTKVIIGSQFEEDRSELYIIQQLNEVFFFFFSGSKFHFSTSKIQLGEIGDGNRKSGCVDEL